MELKECDGIRYFPEIKIRIDRSHERRLSLPHGFSTMKMGNMSYKYGTVFDVDESARRFYAGVPGLSQERRVHMLPLHGNLVRVIKETDVGNTEIFLDTEADGLISSIPGVTLSLCLADCLPIIISDLLVHDGPTAVALVHAGRKGTEGHVVVEAVEKFCEETGCEPSDLLVFIGPGIDYCCCDVDLIEKNINQLVFAGGVGLRHIYMAEECTYCSRGPYGGFRYFSHERSQRSGEKEGRNVAAVALSV